MRRRLRICRSGRNERSVLAFRRRDIASIVGYGHNENATPRKMNEMRKRMFMVRYPGNKGVYGGNSEGIRNSIMSEISKG
jgi:hypothetical protein